MCSQVENTRLADLPSNFNIPNSNWTALNSAHIPLWCAYLGGGVVRRAKAVITRLYFTTFVGCVPVHMPSSSTPLSMLLLGFCMWLNGKEKEGKKGERERRKEGRKERQEERKKEWRKKRRKEKQIAWGGWKLWLFYFLEYPLLPKISLFYEIMFLKYLNIFIHFCATSSIFWRDYDIQLCVFCLSFFFLCRIYSI